MFYTAFGDFLLSGIQRIKETLLLTEEKALDSLPEPFLPISQTIPDVLSKLREKATDAIDSAARNPTHLGDPVSLKAEQSELAPGPEELGAGPLRQSGSGSDSGSGTNTGGRGQRGSGAQGTTSGQKAAEDLHGPDVNSSMLRDPISLEAEPSDRTPMPEARKRTSKL